MTPTPNTPIRKEAFAGAIDRPTGFIRALRKLALDCRALISALGKLGSKCGALYAVLRARRAARPGPRQGLERELWNARKAARLELARQTTGELHPNPAAPDEWRTAPAELARTAPCRAEIPARTLPDPGDEAFDLGF